MGVPVVEDEVGVGVAGAERSACLSVPPAEAGAIHQVRLSLPPAEGRRIHQVPYS